MTQADRQVTNSSRKVGKEQRREQLIKSTINCISKRGIAGLTMADVTKDAGLSSGIINLHFQSKDKLFEDTLLYLSDEYEAYWDKALSGAGDSAAEKLIAIVKSDFSARVCDRKKLAVWFAFWGEAKSRPTYLQICAKSDKRNNDVVVSLCEELVREGDYIDISPASFATGLAALTNGLWLDLLMTPNNIDRNEAYKICFQYIAVSFPGHFDKTNFKL